MSRNLDLVERLRPIAERIGATLPELAVAWVLAQPGVTAAIVGARLPRHVDGWAGASDLELEQSHPARDRRRGGRELAQAPTTRRSRRRTCCAAGRDRLEAE